MNLTAENVARFYYDNRPEFGRCEWRLSTVTVKGIARLTPNYDDMTDEELGEIVRTSGNTLFGESIIIDDSVEGLSLQRVPR